MERVPFDKGRVVVSTQGRDAGHCFVILGVIDDQYVSLCDGDTRKLCHQKKKKVKHLHAKPIKMDNLASLEATNCLKDSDIRSFLKGSGLCIDQPLCKEG